MHRRPMVLDWPSPVLRRSATVCALAAVLLMTGCLKRYYQRNHEMQAVHVLGIGWVNQRTNKVKVFGIGSVDVVRYVTITTTNEMLQQAHTNSLP